MTSPRPANRVAGSAALFVLVLIIYAPVLPPDQTFWQRDIFAFWTSLAAGFSRVVREGSLPLWNPYPSFGLPLLADPGNQILYPFTWLNLWLPAVEWYKLFAVFHAVLAATGMQALARRLGLGRLASFTAGGLFLASGPFQSALSHTVHFTGAAWMPWVIWAMLGILQAPGVRASVVLAAVATLQVFAGSGDLLLMTGACAVPVAVSWLAREWRAVRVAPCARSLALGLALGAMLSAAQWLPTVALIPESMRAQAPPYAQTYWSLHPASLVELLVPNAWSDLPLDDPARSALYEGREPFWACLYLGAIAFGLLACALGNAAAFILAAALLAALVASLGHFAPLYPWLASFTPLAFVRYPVKYTLAAAFFWALLAAKGVEALRRDEGLPRGRLAVSTLLFLMVCLAVALWLQSETFEALLRPVAALRQQARIDLLIKLAAVGGKAAVALALFRLGSGRHRNCLLPILAVLELLPSAQRINGAAPRLLLEAPSRVATLIGPGHRIYTSVALPVSSWQKDVAIKPRGWEWPWALALGREDMVAPPLGSRYDLLGSFDGDVAGVAPPLLGNLTLIVTRAEGTPVARRLLELAGVRYVIAVDEKEWQGLTLSASVKSVFRNPIRAWLVPNPQPLAYLARAARVLPVPDALPTLASAAFDPAREVLLDSGAPLGDPREEFDGELEVRQALPDRLLFRSISTKPAVLVVLGTYHSGWRATIDGQAAPVVRANVMFRGVRLPAGRHEVSMEYRPPSVVLGASLSVTALCGPLAWALVRRVWRRRAIIPTRMRMTGP